MIKNGGYTMLDLATATYKDAAAAFNANKPIMVYDNSQVYYADTCVYDSDNDAYVLTKGGKTITIDSSNNVVSSGEIKPSKLYVHTLTIFTKSVNTIDGCLNAVIISKSNEKIDTPTKLLDTIKSWVDNGYATLGTSGFYNDGTNLINTTQIVYAETGDKYFIQGVDTSGVLHSTSNQVVITNNRLATVEDRIY